ncbi:sensor histidine kinase [Actinoplanes sp. NEAU-A12]|uniref:histidine kinase n=1 Tax=Actinoplanes sandaracinus TaxID=3045177 RepID=A0ABT6WSJ9_9ACTN|nr:sensor histidine kinase [Actinoplanes sandaracinus]MDI6102688.1 sensor histidine kinase [Actinoplanes sandaracinus]
MHEPLRSLWAEPRPPGPPKRVRRDWALVAVLTPGVLAEGLLRPDVPARAVTVAMLLALIPALLWRRTRPLLMVAIAFTVTALVPLFTGHQNELVSSAFLLLLPFALVRWGSGREIAAGAALIGVKIGLSAAGSLSLTDAVAGFVVMVAVFALAAAVRYRARLRARELDQVALLERERLARDLHDTVAHHVSAMAIRAQAGIAVARTQPDGAVDALRVIEAEAVRALSEMRTMVRALRGSEPAELAPNPAIPDVARLAGHSPDGPHVDVELAGDLDGIPPTVGTAIYRLAQESVTNAQRHARHATRISVTVAADATMVRLRVSDDGDGGTRWSDGSGRSGGFGIAGMRERAGLLGGTCEAGPNPGRGWTVTAALPRAAA